ncbi:prepilin-type N-terminal cleavage/methylation domain-containing protein [Patescibacteria group bacterium]|nr:prepilin-type N-terminal cleavage/methylation domain-containing protein [Patescibacteria group bacterium]MBU4057607.1 prepilin-type N-terminal cleavage/methylation domain-containing protein [Patescibacteria group bacterium]MBU4115626.1 prepilin-type N-terminal cleavage/methylation domain-containing protein [Patescibacteria group bacterium]
MQIKKGFSLFEILLSIAIIVVILFVVINLFSNYNKKQVLDNSVEKVSSLLKEARSLTISSKDDNSYGVHFEQDVVVLFKGTTYISDDPNNKINQIDKKAFISEINLNGGGDNVIFQRLTGKTDYYGTVKISLTSDVLNFKTVSIYQTGVVEKN